MATGVLLTAARCARSAEPEDEKYWSLVLVSGRFA
jgi:hypothetical protein